MTDIETTPLFRKLSAFVSLSEAEVTVLKELRQRRRTFTAGRDLIHQGQSDQDIYLLDSGWVCSYKILPDGLRQIVDFQIPGDFLGLRSALLQTSDHSVEPITDIEVSEVFVADLLGAFARTPRLATAVLWAASRDEAMVVEHLVNIGRRDADVRTAHFLLELGARLALVGLGSKEGFACPLTQYHLGDVLGLSAVHVNRVLRRLREGGMLTVHKGQVTFDNYDRLIAFAEFDPTYLDQERPFLK
ncbi:MAG: Crp/Fnr family transcriptional regulator [Sneathiella sp.]|nr:Crp/Fnr family transcriptional regulator [Sneathiella sp.]